MFKFLTRYVRRFKNREAEEFSKTGSPSEFSSEQVRALLGQIVADEQLMQLFRHRLAATVFPITAGTGCGTASSDVQPGTFGTDGSCSTPREYTFSANASTTVPLKVQGASSQTADLQQWKNSAGTVLAEITAIGNLKVSDGAGNSRVGQDSGGLFLFSETNEKEIRFATTDSGGTTNEVVRLASNGFVGIGTNLPGATLNVAGANASIIVDGSGTHSIQVAGTASTGRLGQDTEGFFFASDTNGAVIKFLTNNGSLNEWMRITGAGNVGIGATSPQKPLTIGPSKMEAFEIATPTTPTATAATVTGASLATSTTYGFKVSALDSSGGETVVTSAASASTGSNNAVRVKWSPVAGALNYQVYRNASGGSYDKYTTVPATPGGTFAFPDTGASTTGSGGVPGGSTVGRRPAALGGSNSGSLKPSSGNPALTYYYTVSAYQGASLLSNSPESNALSLSDTSTGSVLLSWPAITNADTYRVYRRLSTGSYSGYYSVPGDTGISTAMEFTDTGNGTATFGGSLPTVTQAYILKDGDAVVSTSIGEPSLANVRSVQQLQPGRPQGSNETYGAGIYAKVDMQNQTLGSEIFAIYGELLNQADGAGGFMKIAHSGQGDAIFVPLYGAGGVALEAATSVTSSATAGSKGIISTVQVTNPNQYNTLFTALWAQNTEPAYGMYYASGAPANALLIQKHTTAADASTQIRVMENGLSRERFAVYNDGATLLSSDVSGGSAHSSPALRLRGTNTSTNVEMQVQNIVSTASGNPYRLSFRDSAAAASGPEVAATSGGELWVKAHSGFAGSESKTRTGSAKTTGTGVQTLTTITLSDSYAYYIVAKVVGRKSGGGDFAFFYKAALVYRQGAGAAIVTVGGNNSVNLGNTPIQSGGATTWTCTMNNSGNDILVQVTGQTATDIYWTATVEYQAVSTDS